MKQIHEIVDFGAKVRARSLSSDCELRVCGRWIQSVSWSTYCCTQHFIRVRIIHARDFSWKTTHAVCSRVPQIIVLSGLLNCFQVFFSCLCKWDPSAYMCIKFNLKSCNNVLFRRNLKRSISTWRFIRQLIFQLSHRAVCFRRLIRLDYYAKVAGKWKQRIVQQVRCYLSTNNWTDNTQSRNFRQK